MTCSQPEAVKSRRRYVRLGERRVRTTPAASRAMSASVAGTCVVTMYSFRFRSPARSSVFVRPPSDVSRMRPRGGREGGLTGPLPRLPPEGEQQQRTAAVLVEAADREEALSHALHLAELIEDVA